jgi:glycosyltransferase involved in cell wall biosynthesis
VTSISFVIPAHNEERLLGRTLEAIDRAARALGEAFEVIVADDASTDRTAEIARAHGARVVSIDRRQIAASRNAGAREAAGDHLVFVDADTVVNENAVRSAVAVMRAGAVGGGSTVRFDGRVPLYGRFLIAAVLPIYRACGLAGGCFLFCTREAFRAVGGFDEALYAAEEVYMSRALRRRGHFVILDAHVTTSGRKLRTYSGRETLAILLRLALSGPKSVRKRDGLDLWYAERRPDVEADV